MTEPEVQKLVCVLVTAFPSAMGKLDEERQRDAMAIYRRMLRDLDYVVANAAVERLLATSKFMPAIAEIRDACLSLSQGEPKAGGDAWGQVLQLISSKGSYRVPGIDFEIADPIARQVVASLGWRNLCLSENQVADRARFIELYDKIAATERRLLLSEGLPAMQRLRAAQAARAIEEEKRAALPEVEPASSMGQLIRLVLNKPSLSEES